MLGLGSGRRSARSPPLFFLLLALGACLAFLALSYWVSSSRSVELQARVAELDAKVRRAAADLSASELQKHQLQLQLQSQLEGHQDEVGQLGLLHRQQIQSEARICDQEKEALNKNITSSTRIIQTLQEQFQELQKGYSHLNQKLQELQKKLTYDITQCSNQINDQKELYEEQIKELNKRLAEATKFQPENRNTEATDQNKLTAPGGPDRDAARPSDPSPPQMRIHSLKILSLCSPAPSPTAANRTSVGSKSRLGSGSVFGDDLTVMSPQQLEAVITQISGTLRTAGKQEPVESDDKPLEIAVADMLEMQRQMAAEHQAELQEAVNRLERRMEESVRILSDVLAPTCKYLEATIGRMVAGLETLDQQVLPVCS
ncbi:Golgi membrane protein 1 isoform X1 [Cetorhinus maximus]